MLPSPPLTDPDVQISRIRFFRRELRSRRRSDGRSWVAAAGVASGEAATGLQHPLPTLRTRRCRRPRKARFRLAGWPLPGEGRTLRIATKGFRAFSRRPPFQGLPCRKLGVMSAAAFATPLSAARAQAAPLPSWNDGPAKQAIVDFVARVTTQGGAGLRPAGRAHRHLRQRRHALGRAADLLPVRVRARPRQGAGAAASRVEGRAAVQGRARGRSRQALAATGEKGMLELVAATHAGMTTRRVRKTVARLARDRAAPAFERPYTDLVYQPMLELLGYLRANGFKTFIVSGGGVEFMRPWPRRSTASRPSRSSARRA